MAQIHDSMDAAKGKRPSEAEQDAAIKASLDKITNKVMVMSGKGGVGKTSVSANLSIALSNMGFKVGLMDVDIHGPDIPRVLGLTGMVDLSPDQKLAPLKYSDNLAVVSVESLIPGKDDAIIWRGPMKFTAIRQFISHVAWGELDFLVIDAPPGTGDEPPTVAQTISDARAVIVTTPQEVALADVRKSINFCKTVKMDIVGLVENMSGFQCPHCRETIDFFGSGGGEKTGADMGIPFLGKIPMDPHLVAFGDAGKSIIEQRPDSPAAKAFMDIAGKLAGKK